MAERELLIEGRAKATIKIKMLIVTITQPVNNINIRRCGDHRPACGAHKFYILPKTGIEPILKSYKESVLPIKLFRLWLDKKLYKIYASGENRTPLFTTSM